MAFDHTRAELQEAARRVAEQFTAQLAQIFRAHEMMLDSLLSSTEFAQELHGSLVNAEAVVRRVFRRWQEKFHSLQGETFRQRADDMADIGRKVLRHLEGKDADRLKALPAGSVLVLQRLLPSDVVSLSRREVAAIVVESLGHGSHAALLVREKSIPTVANFPGSWSAFVTVTKCWWTPIAVKLSSRRMGKHAPSFTNGWSSTTRRWLVKGTCHEPARTLDGELVKVEANLGAYDDVELALNNGADGVGLFRIEQLYLARELPPTEAELLDELCAITSPFRDKPLTIRLLDIGGDKPVPFLRLPQRPIRSWGTRRAAAAGVSPAGTDTARRAVAAVTGTAIRVLVPMVTLEEIFRRSGVLRDAVHRARPAAAPGVWRYD